MNVVIVCFAMYIPEDGDFLSVLFTIGSLLPEQHLAHSRCSINKGWRNEWMNERTIG